MKKPATIASRARFRFLAILLAYIALTTAGHAATVSYVLDNVQLDNGARMVGAFEWTYTPGDFEDGAGVFTELTLPIKPRGTLPALEEPGMIFRIENNQIEITLDGNFHDWGLDVSLKFQSSLSATEASLIDATASAYECCGNGFQNHLFIGGSISPQIASVPLPAAAWLLGSALLGLAVLRGRGTGA